MPTKSTKKRVCCKLCLLQGKYIDDCIKDQNNFSIHSKRVIGMKDKSMTISIKSIPNGSNMQHDGICVFGSRFISFNAQSTHRQEMWKHTPAMDKTYGKDDMFVQRENKRGSATAPC
eukprot:472424_1